MSRITPVVDRVPGTKMDIQGVVGQYTRNVTSQWLTIAPHANPGMLEMFRDRDRLPYRDMVPWAGEFAGKYLTGAVQVLRVTGDEKLRSYLKEFVAQLLPLQDTDGYFGPWPKAARLTNRVDYPDGRVHWTWDTWGHYHLMLGLLLWHEETGDKKVFAAVLAMADAICDMYLAHGKNKPKARLCDTGNTDKNLSPIHTFGILFTKTGQPRYLQMMLQICDEFAAKDAQGNYLTGDYLLGSLAGKEFFESPRPRWESLHAIMGLTELYHATGKSEYRQAFEQIWRSIARGDRHNNGGFSSGEKATGNPFDPSPIETCCTIAWMALSVEMLRLTGESLVADELELSLLNSITGMHSPSGRWATYDTPMHGVRIASAHAIVFQSREGTPELNCCSVNSVRGFGLLSDWAVLRSSENTLNLNYFGSGTISVPLTKSVSVTLTQTTEYPVEPNITLAVTPSKASAFTLNVRIPRWSRKTVVKVNGVAIKGVTAGTYLPISRTWKKGDKVQIALDFSLHQWVGKWDAQGKVSLYRGPLLLAYDRRYNDMDPDKVPAISLDGLKAKKLSWKAWLPPTLLLEFTAADGQKLRLCDFASAGQGGTPYHSWLPVSGSTDSAIEPFAPTAAEYRLLSLLRFGPAYKQFEEDKLVRRAGSSWITKPKLMASTLTIQRYHANLLEAVEDAHEYLAANHVDDQANHALRATLARLQTQTPFLTPEFLQSIKELQTTIRNDFEISIPVLDFTCSALQPAQESIFNVTLPPAGLSYEPLKLVTSENFCDVRVFHNGKHGLLYLRAVVKRPVAAQGKIIYGADGPIRLWLNGKELGTFPDATNPAVAEAYKTPVTWQQGDNEIIIALMTNLGRAWGVFTGTL
jgi:uncharacterized protein